MLFLLCASKQLKFIGGVLFLSALAAVAQEVQTSWPLPANQRLNVALYNCPGPFNNPQPSKVAHDPLVTDTSNEVGKGIFAYAPLVWDAPEDPNNRARYFVLQGRGVTQNVGQSETVTASYATGDGEGDTFDPQWAPGGKFLSYKNGDWKGAHPWYRLFYWDLERRRVVLASGDVKFPQTRWSGSARYLAYIAGGDSLGTEDDGPTALYVNDTQHGKSVLIASHPVLNSGDDYAHDYRELPFFSWQGDNTLFYAGKQTKTPTSKAPTKPSIFQVDVRTGKSTLVTAEGYAPLPSPDNQWLAFMGWPRATPIKTNTRNRRRKIRSQDNSRSQSLKLCLLHRKTGRVVPVKNLLLERNPQRQVSDLNFKWTLDSRSLVVVTGLSQSKIAPRSREGARAGTPPKLNTEGAIQVDKVVVEDELAKSASLQPVGQVPLLGIPDASTLRVQTIGPSLDGNLFYLKHPAYKLQDQASVDESFLAIDLRTGAVTHIADFHPQDQYTSGWSWYEVK